MVVPAVVHEGEGRDRRVGRLRSFARTCCRGVFDRDIGEPDTYFAKPSFY